MKLYIYWKSSNFQFFLESFKSFCDFLKKNETNSNQNQNILKKSDIFIIDVIEYLIVYNIVI